MPFPFLLLEYVAAMTVDTLNLVRSTDSADLLRPLRENWPLIAAAGGIIWHLSGLSHSLKSMAQSFASMSKRIDKRLDSHSETIDEINVRVSRIEGATGTPLHSPAP